jgi:hypothetical protein
MITIELSPDSTPDALGWRCLVYGDLFELAIAGTSSADQLAGGPLQPGEVPLVISHKAPKGFEFRRLNQKGAEVTADIMGGSSLLRLANGKMSLDDVTLISWTQPRKDGSPTQPFPPRKMLHV